jgi:phosphohistidine phosphatase
MELYFLRHGTAEKRGEWPGDDGVRPLTEAGADTVRRAADTLRRAGLSVDLIVTSPLTRARQTADIAADVLALHERLTEDLRLAPGFGHLELAAILAEHDFPSRVMFVGHEPDFSLIIEALTGGRVVCKKGGIARVDVFDADALKG